MDARQNGGDASVSEILGLILGLNLSAFAAMGLDKRQAQIDGRRISERTLLLLAWAGGGLGAVAGQALFRHKTRKQPIAALLRFSPLSLAAAALWWRLG
jgi:uncharacterized membrane protein YsdA (DUF1294 family)